MPAINKLQNLFSGGFFFSSFFKNFFFLTRRQKTSELMWCVSVMCTQTILIRLCNENKTYNLLFCALNDTITCKLWWIVPGWATTSLAFWFFIVKCTIVNCCWHQTTQSATTNVLLVHSLFCTVVTFDWSYFKLWGAEPLQVGHEQPEEKQNH